MDLLQLSVQSLTFWLIETDLWISCLKISIAKLLNFKHWICDIKNPMLLNELTLVFHKAQAGFQIVALSSISDWLTRGFIGLAQRQHQFEILFR